MTDSMTSIAPVAVVKGATTTGEDNVGRAGARPHEGLAGVSWVERGAAVFPQVGGGLRALAVYYLGDGDDEVIDGVEGAGGVVVVGGLPCGGRLSEGDVAYVVDEEVAPTLAGLGR